MRPSVATARERVQRVREDRPGRLPPITPRPEPKPDDAAVSQAHEHPGASALVLQLSLPARASSIATVRGEVSRAAGALALPSQLRSDICLAVTEACTNVVLHAYPEGHDGPLEVTAAVSQGERPELTLLVRDHGRGIVGAHSPLQYTSAPRLRSEPAPSEVWADSEDASADPIGLGLGLHLMGSLARSLRLGEDELGRTTVEMTFDVPGTERTDRQPGAADTAAPVEGPAGEGA
ncbi:MAG: ATP-binding protein [Solirubrobacteraceae bacterium]